MHVYGCLLVATSAAGDAVLAKVNIAPAMGESQGFSLEGQHSQDARS